MITAIFNICCLKLSVLNMCFLCFQGVKIKMDDSGNIMIKKVTRANVYVKGISSPDNSIANDIIKVKGQLEMEKAVKVIIELNHIK